jgi:hypothetical protein
MKVVKKCLTALLLINLHKKWLFVAFILEISYIRKIKVIIN